MIKVRFDNFHRSDLECANYSVFQTDATDQLKNALDVLQMEANELNLIQLLSGIKTTIFGL